MKLLWCWRCGVEMPMLDEDEYRQVMETVPSDTSISIEERFRPMLAEYERITGRQETNPNAIYHHRVSLYGRPCSSCGKPLRTPRARRCGSCQQRRVPLKLKLYRTEPPMSLLAFDDARFGLKGELFVPSATQVLDAAAEAFLGGKCDRLDIAFDSMPFDGWKVKAIKSSPPPPIQALEDGPFTGKLLLEALGIDAPALTGAGQYQVAAGLGTWYRVAKVRQTGAAQEIVGRELWLCDALQHYFPVPADEIYLKVEEGSTFLPSGEGELLRRPTDTPSGMEPCPFCFVSADRVLMESDVATAILDGFPVTEGHTLVIPRRHVDTVFDLSLTEQRELWGFVTQVRQTLIERLRPDGFNIGINDGAASGQTVEHAHIHVIPRRAGDVVDPRGGVRWVIPAKAAYWDEP